ncbi:hypothetical protein THARTR1_10215 [Trichoderma harzianum]|uniref:NmrA-like domain-containing protein n=1 Tax=Trichoderma harzianum TaxID=5544 RepID=A0A2K0TU27_TRIHA|nr:hypothetical protein THARTR1_10215 [Trichoderma harzianum]
MVLERVLVIGATGNIGVAAVKGALRSGRQVLAVHVGSSQGIQVVEASVVSDTGVKGVVDQVKAGKLPAFQHVYTCVGGEYTDVPLKDITTERLRKNINMAFESNFFAYRDTIEYLYKQNHPNSTWTICTGSQGDEAMFALPAMGQGPLFSMATAAARENEKTNVRVNEVYLMFRVEVDEAAKEHGVSSSSEFASVYEGILNNPEIRSSRVRVASPADFTDLKWAKKF